MSSTETRRDSVDVGICRRLLEDDPEPDPDHSCARRTCRAARRDLQRRDSLRWNAQGIKVLLIALTPILYQLIRTLYGDAIRRGSVRTAHQLRVALTNYRHQRLEPVRFQSLIRDHLIVLGVPTDRATAVATAVLADLTDLTDLAGDHPQVTVATTAPELDRR